MAITVTTQSDLKDIDQAPLAAGMQRALVAGLASWSTDRQGLGGRLAASAWALYGWTRRSTAYMRRQSRGQWGVLPFVSPPRKKSYGGIGKFLYSLTKPGIGHNVYHGTVSSTEASAILTVAAARGLNFAREGGIYLDEWGRMYPADQLGIEPRLERLGDQALQQAIT